ncbi:MFS transporter [Actinacidiphila sp. ITFR-21]|uniref:MFS transporter n=1 Tax=Actinacidiphila sp. ITFR-21 TaxID=3075199 RepID=UPI00288A58FB|nr:MFS transporter [Streptomyces sp. ITFR-21]WNI16061.1 MFS transporter [Streptomyces sp. ITFR-21]
MTHSPDDARKRGLTLLASCLGFVVVILDVSVVNVATKVLNKDFGSSLSGLEWVINGYTLTFAAFLLTTGALGDRLAPKYVFQLGFALFAVTSLVCGLSVSLPMLIAARVVQGVGAAMIVPSSLSLVNGAFPDQAERTRAVSLWAASGGLALALGPVIGGVLISLLGWRSIFLVNVPIAAIGIWLTAANAPGNLQATGGRRRSFDLPGQTLAVVCLGALTAGVVEANGLGWGSVTVTTCLAVFVLAAIGFVVAEGRSTDPMLPLRMFRHRAFTATALTGLLLNFSFYGLIFVFSLFFQSSWGYSPIVTGCAFLPMTAMIMVSNLACGPLTKRFGVRAVLVTGNAVGAAGYLAMLPAVHSGGGYAGIAVPFLVAGAGIGLVVPAMTNAMLAAAEPGTAGIASGVLNGSRQIGGLIGVAVMGLLVGDSSAASFVSGLRSALVCAAVALAAGIALGALGVRPAPRRTLATAGPEPVTVPAAPAAVDEPVD